MTVTIGALTINALQSLPIGYEDVNVRQGIVVRAWDIDGIVEQEEAAAISNLYEAWYATRKTEPDTMETGTIGTTVAFTGDAGGRNWTAVACWFDKSPEFTRTGYRWRVSLRLVNAAEALAAHVADKKLTTDAEEATTLTFGTLTVGGVVLTLLEDPDARGDGPSVEIAATGTDIISGPVRSIRLRNIKGYGPNPGNTDYQTLLTWYDTQVANLPSYASWWPISPPTPSPEVITTSSGKVTRYIISFTLRYIE